MKPIGVALSTRPKPLNTTVFAEALPSATLAQVTTLRPPWPPAFLSTIIGSLASAATLDGVYWHWLVGSRTLTTQDTPVLDSAQVLFITALSVSDTSEKRTATLRRIASLRATCSPE